MEFDELSRQVIGCALEVHRNLGPGLLESTYRQSRLRTLAREHSIPNGSSYPCSIQGIAQILTYMRLAKIPIRTSHEFQPHKAPKRH